MSWLIDTKEFPIKAKAIFIGDPLTDEHKALLPLPIRISSCADEEDNYIDPRTTKDLFFCQNAFEEYKRLKLHINKIQGFVVNIENDECDILLKEDHDLPTMESDKWYLSFHYEEPHFYLNKNNIPKGLGNKFTLSIKADIPTKANNIYTKDALKSMLEESVTKTTFISSYYPSQGTNDRMMRFVRFQDQIGKAYNFKMLDNGEVVGNFFLYKSAKYLQTLSKSSFILKPVMMVNSDSVTGIINKVHLLYFIVDVDSIIT